MNEMKNDTSKSPAQGTGSDTVSAARISAGTSVGMAGQSPMPHDQRGDAGSGSGSSGQSNWAQGATSGVGQGASRLSRSGTDKARHTSSGDLSDKASDALEQTSEWARDQYEYGSRQLDQAREQSMRQLRQARGGIERFVSDNPLMVGVMGLAAGLAIGALLPRTRQEDRAFGRWADEVRDQGLRYARDATQRGREYMDEALGGGESEDEWRPEDGGVRSSSPRYQNH